MLHSISEGLVSSHGFTFCSRKLWEAAENGSSSWVSAAWDPKSSGFTLAHPICCRHLGSEPANESLVSFKCVKKFIEKWNLTWLYFYSSFGWRSWEYIKVLLSVWDIFWEWVMQFCHNVNIRGYTYTKQMLQCHQRGGSHGATITQVTWGWQKMATWQLLQDNNLFPDDSLILHRSKKVSARYNWHFSSLVFFL